MTEFQSRVYAALCKVPAGQVISYGQLAHAVGCRSAQAVGQALLRNPDAPRIPCHRVVNAQGELGGYFGKLNSDEKRALLHAEGINLNADGTRLCPPIPWFHSASEKGLLPE